jgi:hypothetical protein
MNDIFQGLQMQNKITDFIKTNTRGILQTVKFKKTRLSSDQIALERYAG